MLVAQSFKRQECEIWEVDGNGAREVAIDHKTERQAELYQARRDSLEPLVEFVMTEGSVDFNMCKGKVKVGDSTAIKTGGPGNQNVGETYMA